MRHGRDDLGGPLNERLLTDGVHVCNAVVKISEGAAVTRELSYWVSPRGIRIELIERPVGRSSSPPPRPVVPQRPVSRDSSPQVLPRRWTTATRAFRRPKSSPPPFVLAVGNGPDSPELALAVGLPQVTRVKRRSRIRDHRARHPNCGRWSPEFQPSLGRGTCVGHPAPGASRQRPPTSSMRLSMASPMRMRKRPKSHRSELSRHTPGLVQTASLG
jgi:hypothetical protein